MTKKEIILAFYLVVILFLSFSLLLNKVLVQKRAVGEALLPSQVIVSNITSRSFTVSWFTEKKTTGSVIFPAIGQIFNDNRGAATWSQIHWVTLENLSPNQKYYFAIKSGGEVFGKNLDGSWGKNGIAEEQKTPPEINFDPSKPPSPINTEGAYSLEQGAWNSCPDGTINGAISPCFRPNLIWGKVVDKENQPIAEAIVFLEIPGKSTILSTLTNNKGQWAMNLANLYQKDLSGFVAYDPRVDLVRIKALDEKGRTASSYQLIPYVFSDKNKDITNPVILELTSPLSTQPPSSTQSFRPTSTPTKLPTLSSFLELKIKFQGINKKGPDKLISLALKNLEGETILQKKEITLKSDETGIYQGQVDFLPQGTFNILVKEITHLGKQITSFKISQGRNLLDISNSPFVAGDLNNDNRINAQDLGILLAEFRSQNPQGSIADLNSDGLVNSVDLGILIANYRQEGD